MKLNNKEFVYSASEYTKKYVLTILEKTDIEDNVVIPGNGYCLAISKDFKEIEKYYNFEQKQKVDIGDYIKGLEEDEVEEILKKIDN